MTAERYKAGDRLDVTIEKIVPRGLGMAFAEKLTVFVPLSAVGDRLSVRLTQVKGRTAFGEIERVIEPSAVRVQPPCKYFGKCGGCDFQHLTYAAQLDAKAAIIKDSLRRIGKLDIDREIPMIPSPDPFRYRSRAQWHLNTRNTEIGYFRRGSHEVIDVESCPILDPVLDETLAELRSDLDWKSFWSEEASIDAAVGLDEKISLSSVDLAEPEVIEFQAAGERYSYDAGTFFQGNSLLVESLIETALGEVRGGHALDLYCGVGLFSLPLARRFESVTGVEDSERAIDFARKNATNAGLENLRFFQDNVSEFLSAREIGSTEFVLLDPPRSGTEKGVIEQIVKLRASHIAYVSCDPAILGRDLRVFVDAGYSIASIVGLDLFPQTHHVETVVHLTKA